VEAFLEIEADFAEVVKRCAAQKEMMAAAAPIAASGGNRIDDDLSLALELLDEWVAEPPDFDQPRQKYENLSHPNKEPVNAP
jgi:hypothetical protein